MAMRGGAANIAAESGVRCKGALTRRTHRIVLLETFCHLPCRRAAAKAWREVFQWQDRRH
jgi:hypothetical protein